MPAYIAVHSGITAGSNLWIERNVVRVGSDPECEICIPSPNLPAQALTIDFRNGEYFINNRSSQTFVLDGQPIAPAQRCTWVPGMSLDLDSGLVISLGIHGDLTPAPRPALPHEEEYDKDDAYTERTNVEARAGETKQGMDGKTVSQLAVIGLCVLGSIGLLLYKFAGSGEESSESDNNQSAVMEFDELVQLVNAEEGVEASKVLIRELQFAEMARIRGDRELAIARMTELRTDLLYRQRILDGKDLELANEMLIFVQHWLTINHDKS